MKIKILLVILLSSSVLAAQLRVAAVFADNMVLQQGKANRVWGWAKPGQLVEVNFKQKAYPAVANAAGEWTVWLEATAAGNAGTLQVKSESEKVVFNNIAIGEVWVCSGQSNMEWRMDMLQQVEEDARELKSANNPQIRFTVINKWLATTPAADAEIQNKWEMISPATIGNCSAVAYWYAKKLQQQLNVPVGLVISAWGGTPAQSWTSLEGLYALPNYVQTYVKDIRPLDLNGMSQKKKELYQQFLQKLDQQAAYAKAVTLPGFNDSEWKEMMVPRPWEELGYPALDGVVAYRIYFNVEEADAGKEAILNTPGIDDIDSTYINGIFIGSTDQWDKPRTYTIPAGLLKTGKNLLVVRVTDNQGGGGFAAVPEKFHVQIGSKQIPLAGKARFDIIAELPDLTAGHGAIEHQPAVLFNGMIAPLLPMSIRGVIWYQGESNADTKEQSIEYRTLFPAMITDWRNRWGQGEFPFLFVQLASYGPLQKKPVESNWAFLREAQSRTLSLPNTALAVATDIGNPSNIHPTQKKEVGDRLAAEALRMTYGKSKMIANGPRFTGYSVKGSQVILRFENTGKGLLAKNGPLKHFAVAGTDRQFYWADAVITGNTIVVTCKQVTAPVAVRYAWADSPVDANLYNKDGYPASPFRTDSWD